MVKDQDTGAKQIVAVEAVVFALIAFLAAGGTAQDHISTVRRATGCLAVRRIP
jgi:hypothetical protein